MDGALPLLRRGLGSRARRPSSTAPARRVGSSRWTSRSTACLASWASSACRPGSGLHRHGRRAPRRRSERRRRRRHDDQRRRGARRGGREGAPREHGDRSRVPARRRALPRARGPPFRSAIRHGSRRSSCRSGITRPPSRRRRGGPRGSGPRAGPRRGWRHCHGPVDRAAAPRARRAGAPDPRGRPRRGHRAAEPRRDRRAGPDHVRYGAGAPRSGLHPGRLGRYVSPELAEQCCGTAAPSGSAARSARCPS